jgi:cellulose biosynthesis protein BcsQ
VQESGVARAKVISFINYKRGVGNSTTTYHVSCSLARDHNKKVLPIDIDPQTNLTFLCAPIEAWEKEAEGRTIANLYQRFLDRKPLDTNRFIWQTPIQVGRRHVSNVNLIPCDVDLLGEDDPKRWTGSQTEILHPLAMRSSAAAIGLRRMISLGALLGSVRWHSPAASPYP